MSEAAVKYDEMPVTATIDMDDLLPYAGVCALVHGTQVALFYLPDENPAVHALDNWDPIGEANVLSRGVLGDIDGELVVASPLYKQHFSLIDGRCLEDEKVRVPVHDASIDGNIVRITARKPV